ncbi:arginase family protein [Pseudalkalibacillus sp. R45]|uniref:arginase family protein n=1 Tax=Pseudalkalibacillus sp. R45 TaxID=3457433 RepID=UPI003FCD6449
MQKNIQIIHAPINLGLRRDQYGRERGCDKLPNALESLDFHSSICARDIRRMTKPCYPKEEIFVDGALNSSQIASFSVDLANVVEDVLNASDFPLVIGGDCSVLVGSTLAIARRGKYGLIHIDAHPDYYNKYNKERTATAGMDLAIVTGKGTDILANLENRKPYISSELAFTFGYRESDPEKEIIEEVVKDGITCWSAERSIREGIEKTANALTAFINRADIDGYWLHLDADVLDASIMPCVDCPEPNGLQWKDLTYILKSLLATNKITGMNVTILDPLLDSSGEVTRSFNKMLIEVLRELNV